MTRHERWCGQTALIPRQSFYMATTSQLTTLDSMATHAEPSALERLQALVQEQAGPAREWRMKLPTLRAQASATSAMLGELARTSPTTPIHERDYADVVLAALPRNGLRILRLGYVMPSLREHMSTSALRETVCEMAYR